MAWAARQNSDGLLFPDFLFHSSRVYGPKISHCLQESTDFCFIGETFLSFLRDGWFNSNHGPENRDSRKHRGPH